MFCRIGNTCAASRLCVSAYVHPAAVDTQTTCCRIRTQMISQTERSRHKDLLQVFHSRDELHPCVYFFH